MYKQKIYAFEKKKAYRYTLIVIMSGAKGKKKVCIQTKKKEEIPVSFVVFKSSAFTAGRRE